MSCLAKPTFCLSNHQVQLPEWFDGLRRLKILVRWFASGSFNDRLRISIGSQEEMKKCMDAIRILKKRLGS
jgi:histidinol-phosphate/aromatic aminotransferase/cobyric acid decarboxylase-like protein